MIVYSIQNSAAPKTPKEIPNLALFKHEKGPLSPLTYKTFSLGTLTSFKWIIPVLDIYKDIFPSISGVSIPSIKFHSKIKPLISLSSASLAQTTKISAIGELVIQFLEPLRMKLPSDYYLHFVLIELGSLPTFGSVNPKQPINSPEINPGNNFSLIDSVPN